MLVIKDLHVSRDNKKILRGISLKVNKGEVHALMGPNGSGKSTLANAVSGSPLIKITKGSILLNDKNIKNLDVDARSKLGLFMAFQYPVEVSGVPMLQFLKLIYENKFNTKITPGKFLMLLNAEAEKLHVSKDLIHRYLNEGFSGGEKKKVEILQMSVLKPYFSILDETDSGLDISSLKIVANGVDRIRRETEMGVIVITHYSRILDYLKPDYVHVLKNGKIVKSGGLDVAEELEKTGYEAVSS
ncbi:Fe-S cluster assembly ATPase SufC [candidate division WWE3 bacterium CG10_big_fil_rev_8_21_14_0_10_32_10]|uniref:Fe-S cluster assembly ATPase SufC n=1 Tax=candidate division WWE3 bacterium CG10_big_fil_rev_8_21_14_0_10_32_10 TaxID=1975090 RepID=A0A2H0R9K0_UNCKA|nr:MAG: Fe-S cluster assembly ATPase SufC [candidate division WWE3 bacterium CG10_big_fil_rev_8_21_14_0_10_32_10]